MKEENSLFDNLPYFKDINDRLDHYQLISFRLLKIKKRFDLNDYEYYDLINKKRIEIEREYVDCKAHYVLRLEGTTLVIESNLIIKQPSEYIELSL